jgi:hypothetical protein
MTGGGRDDWGGGGGDGADCSGGDGTSRDHSTDVAEGDALVDLVLVLHGQRGFGVVNDFPEL